jgi:serine/threonine protein kinase
MAGLEGKILARYHLQELTGKGGMADVYRAHDTVFDREVAVKVFKRDDEDLLRRFIREARLMASLHHPHLMPIYDTGESSVDGMLLYYIVMPFMEGGPLRARIRRAPLSLREACHLLSGIADALDYVHRQGIIHRDIKSSNVLLDPDGNCYLADFGIARSIADVTQLTSTGSVLGTADYVAPELFEPHYRANEMSDLYSLGVLAFEMVTGKLPFSAENQIALAAMHVHKRPPTPSTIVSTIPPQVDRVILKALAKVPEQRYKSATDFAAAFCRATTSSALPAQQAEDGLLIKAVSPKAEAAPDAPTVAAPQPAALPMVSSLPVRAAERRSSQVQARSGTSRPPMQRRRLTPQQRQARVMTILALLAVLAVVGPIVYVLLTYSHSRSTGESSLGQTQTAFANNQNTAAAFTPSSTPNLTATAQAAAATATAQAQNATATAIAGATATVIAQATAQAEATVGVIQTATAGQAVYSDPLNNLNNPATQAANWDQNSHCAFKSDGYHVTENISLHGCQETANTYQNATITVDVTINSGNSGGLFFHVQTDFLGNYSGYLFEVDSQGNYKISKSKDFSNPLDRVILQDWTASSALKTGTATNKLEVIINGAQFLFYANSVFLTEIQDSTFSAPGTIAFVATADGSSADVVYRNLNVYNLLGSG